MRAAHLDERALRTLWRGRIPRGMITVIAGRPGEGKGLVGRFIVAEVSRDEPAILSSREDPIREVVRPGLRLAGADLNNVFIADFTLPEELDALESEIRASGSALVLIDPVASHLSVSVTNDQSVRRALTPLAELAHRTDCAVVCVTHVVKAVQPRAHPLHAISGSGAGLVAAARVAFLLGRDPGGTDHRILALAKSNVGTDSLPSLAFEVDVATTEDASGQPFDVAWVNLVGDCDVSARDLIATDRGPSGVRKDAIEFVRRTLADGPLAANAVKELAAAEGISPTALRRAADELRVVRRRVGFGPGSVINWELEAPEMPGGGRSD